MINIGLFQNIKSFFNKGSTGTVAMKFVTENGNGFYSWGGKLYQSDIVRACIRPKVKAVGKLVAKHIRTGMDSSGEKTLAVNPDAYMRFLLEEPNPLMTGQMLQEKLAAQLILNGNAFALIIRNENGYPSAIYPITASSVEARYTPTGILYLRFWMQKGKMYDFWYSDIIHLRQDFFENDVFGESPAPALMQTMNVVSTIDQGIINAIKNSAFIQWLVKFTTSMRPEDIKAKALEFADTYLATANNGTGVAAVDNKAELTQVKSNDFVPNATQMDKSTQRIYSFINTNTKIVQSSYTEDEWNSYYEAEIEPIVIQLNGEYTRKLFSRKERGFGNKIMFEAANLQCASISTKLQLMQMVDRGSLTPNEWRATLNLAPVPGGDEPIRRLDTRPTSEDKQNEKNTD